MSTAASLAIGLLAGILFLAACGGSGATATAEAGEIRDCGTEQSMHGTNTNVEGRQCLVEAFEAGEPAIFVSNAVTVEGAPTVTTYRVLRQGVVEVEYDGRRDPLGPGLLSVQRCTRLVPIAEWRAAMGGGPPDEIVFVEDGCEPHG